MHVVNWGAFWGVAVRFLVMEGVMSNKVGKTIVNRVDWGRWIVSSVRVHNKRLVVLLAGRMALSEPEWGKFMAGQASELDAVTEALWVTELELARERSDDPTHRAERDQRMGELVEVLVRVRSLLDSTQPGLVQRFGLDGEMPRTPNGIEAFSRNVLENLREANQTYQSLGFTFSTIDLADQLEPPYQALQEKLVMLKGEDRKAEDLLILRDRQLDAWTRVYQVVAGLMENIYRMCQEDELARRVRPTIARSSGAVGPEDEKEIVGGEPSAGDVGGAVVGGEVVVED